MKVLYTAKVTATSGRDGKVRADDGSLELGLAIPKGMGGPGGPGTNPEQLFAAGYAACFGSALKLVGRMQRVDVDHATITADVSIGPDGKGGYALAVELHGNLPGIERSKAEALMEATHHVCPYSNATRGNIDVKLIVD